MSDDEPRPTDLVDDEPREREADLYRLPRKSIRELIAEARERLEKPKKEQKP